MTNPSRLPEDLAHWVNTDFQESDRERAIFKF